VHSSAMIGVVTVTFNSASVIRDFMDSLLKQSYENFRLYVVDNVSSDNTLELLAQYSDPRIVIIHNPTNVGIAEGNNIGISAALRDGCASVLFINNDTVFGPDVISGLHEGLRHYECAMIAPKILYFDAPGKIWWAGGGFSRLRGRSISFGFNQKDDGRFDQPQQVEFSPACCMLVAREVFERIGTIDPNYFIYFDDADFCLRAHRAGLKLVYSPDISLFHKVSSLIGHRSDISVRYVTRNHVYFVLKHFGVVQNLYYLPICQAHIFVRCLLANNRARAFFIAQKAFWEGISVYKSTRNQPA
jgi:GT2 family glycosyltransferase